MSKDESSSSLRRRGFTTLALLSAGALLFSSTYVALRAVGDGAQAGLGRLARRPRGAFTQAPTRPFLGRRPGRDPHGRGGMWSADRRARAEFHGEFERAVAQTLDPGAGESRDHTLAVAAEPGSSYPWEGSVGGVNTGNGNKLTSLHLLGWKARGGMALDFTLYHNSQTNYADELGHGWTWTYDVYVNNLEGDPVLHWGDGTSVPYAAPGGSGGGGILDDGGGGTPSAPPTYAAPAGIHDSLAKNADGTWTVTKKGGAVYSFNAAGFLKRVEDRNGNAIVLTLNAGNYVTRITDPTGRYVNVTVDANDRFTGITDMTGRSWTFAQNASGDLVSVTWPSLGDGQTYADGFAYDSAHRITTRTDRRGKAWTLAYNPDGSLASEADPLGHATTYAYGSTATTITDALGHASVHNYATGRMASSVDAAGYSVSYNAYDAQNDVTSATDARGETSTSTFDAMGNVLSTTDPLGHTKSVAYNALNEPLTVTDALGHTTTNAYDANGNLLTVTNALGKTVLTNSVGPYGLMSTTTNALGKTISYAYDTDGGLTMVTDPTNVSIGIGYDALGRATSATDAAGAVTTTAYDAWDRATSVTHPSPNGGAVTSSTTYLPTGQIEVATDELGRTTTMVYDDAGRPTSIANPRGDVESYGYDAANRRTSVTNGRGKTRTYTYTSRGNVASATLPDGSAESWAYDGGGNVTAYTNGNGDSILYGFDDAGRQALVDYPTGADTSFAYDDANRRTSMADATGTTTWAYDAVGQETTFASPQGTQANGYDDAGHRISLNGTGISRAWTYDDAGRPLTLSNESGETTTYAYDAAGRLSTTTLSNGQVSTFGYDVLSHQTSVTHKGAGGTTISAESYAYGDTGDLTNKTVDGATTTYTYDSLDQLLTESRQGYSAGYTYDANGNRASKTLNGTTETYLVDDGDKLLSVSQGGTTLKSYGYDAAGRTTSVTSAAGTTTLGYDVEGRVTGIVYPGGGTNAFSYNGLDTRVGKTDSSGTSAYRRDGAGVTAAVLSDGSAVYTPGVSQRRGGATTFDLPDRLGTASRQTDASAGTTATRSYDAFGNLLASTGAPKGPFGFAGTSGYQEDGDSGLKLLGHRYYDPSTGRFLTRDPVKDGRNWYAYCANNPLRSVDPTGLSGMDILQGIGDGIENFAQDVLVGAAVVAVVAVLAPEAVCALIVIGTAAAIVGAASDAAGAISGTDGNGNPLSDKQRATLATEAVLMLVTLGLAEGGGCFAAGTLVLMADGSSKPIEAIGVGDRVMTRDQRGDAASPTEGGAVSGTTAHGHDGSLLLRFAGGATVHTTPEHPFYVGGRGFTPAGELKVGDAVAESGRGLDRLEAVVRVPGEARVYNLTVAGDHTYFVKAGDAWLWVHNSCEPGTDLGEAMSGSEYTPTQGSVDGGKVNRYSQDMQNGNWDWNKQDYRNPLIVDSEGNIEAGHHRIVAAAQAGVEIPPGAIIVRPGVTFRFPRPWGNVIVK